jgi:hypothetical protein
MKGKIDRGTSEQVNRGDGGVKGKSRNLNSPRIQISQVVSPANRQPSPVAFGLAGLGVLI